jgi:hypothetical protein
VLVVFRRDPVDNPIRLQHIFLTQDLFGVLVLAVRAKNLAGDRLAIFFGIPARRGFHLNQKFRL